MVIGQQLPQVFIASSSEGRDVADHLQAALSPDVEAEVWHQGAFGPSSYPIPALVEATARSDFAVVVASPDDVVERRGKTSATARDNVIFELGLFIGAIGLERTYLMKAGDLDLPSDLSGVTHLSFSPRKDQNLGPAVGPAATQVRTVIARLGLRPRGIEGSSANGSPSTHEVALKIELDRLSKNATAQGWTVKTNSPTTLRLKSRRGRVHTLSKSTPERTRAELREFAKALRADGLRVNRSLRVSINKAPTI